MASPQSYRSATAPSERADMQDVHRALAQAQLNRLLATWLALEETIGLAQERLLATRSAEDAELLARLLNACTDDLRRLSAASPQRRAP